MEFPHKTDDTYNSTRQYKEYTQVNFSFNCILSDTQPITTKGFGLILPLVPGITLGSMKLARVNYARYCSGHRTAT